ncbi:hypothetical protein [Aliikangiella maris]|uniref:Uncharacterized protein n=2 Tax=Aliikangiella maris TaxID=3162458 RepID=A0ABV3MRW2_9GAMM
MQTLFDIHLDNQIKYKAQKQIAQQQLENALKLKQHTLLIMTTEEYLDFYLVNYKRINPGSSNLDAFNHMNSIVQNSTEISSSIQKNWQKLKERWDQHSESIQFVGSLIPIFSDSATLTVLAKDLHRGGSLFTKVKVNFVGAKPYIIIQGYAGLRHHLIGTRYLLNNPKVVSMGLGYAGASKALRAGGIFSVIFSVGFHSINLVFDDTVTWHFFVGSIATDVIAAFTAIGLVKAGISFLTFVSGATMVAVGPMIIVVFAGGLLGIGLSMLFNHLELPQKIAGYLKEGETRLNQELNHIQYNSKRLLSTAIEDPYGFISRLTNAPYFKF